MSERLQKFLARAGVASRRHAEGLITSGRVAVNNQVVTTLGTKVVPGDLVTVDGTLVSPPERSSWYLLHKPPGVVTTLSDPEGRPTVAGFLADVPGRVFPVGRLDWDAEGALLFTDDGGAAHRLLHPSFEVPRTYLVKVKGTPSDETLQRLVDGVRLEDGPAHALKARRHEAAERNTWIELQIGEGRPHLVKRLCAAVGHPVLRLFRPAQAGVSVAGLAPGQVRPLSPEEVRRVEGIAAGEPLPPVELFLPPRRHGRSGDDDVEAEPAMEVSTERAVPGGGEQRPRPAPRGAAGKGRPGREGRPFIRERSARPGRGPERSGRPPARGLFSRGPQKASDTGGDRSEGRPGRAGQRPSFGHGAGRGSRPPGRGSFSPGPRNTSDAGGDRSEGRPGRAGQRPSFGRGAGRGSRPSDRRAFSPEASADFRPARAPAAHRGGGRGAPRRPETGERWHAGGKPRGRREGGPGRMPRGDDRRSAERRPGPPWKRSAPDAGAPWKGRERNGRDDGARAPRQPGEFRERRGPGEARTWSPRPGGRPVASGFGGRPGRGKFGIPRPGTPRSFSGAPATRSQVPGGRPAGGPRRPPRGSHAPGPRGNSPGPRGGGAGGRGRGGRPPRR